MCVTLSPHSNISFGFWLCRNPLAVALTPRDFGHVLWSFFRVVGFSIIEPGSEEDDDHPGHTVLDRAIARWRRSVARHSTVSRRRRTTRHSG